MIERALLAVLVFPIVSCGDRWDWVEDKFGVITAIDPTGAPIAANGQPIDLGAVNDEVARTLGLWRAAFRDDRVVCDLASVMPDVFISFRENPFLRPEWYGEQELLGLMWQLDDIAVLEVGFRPDLDRSALGHELGHAVLWWCGLQATEPYLFMWAQAHGVPYKSSGHDPVDDGKVER